jgi:hypothetical protein
VFELETPWYVAVRDVVPGASAVTTPPAPTVATPVFDDCQVACEDTFVLTVVIAAASA